MYGAEESSISRLPTQPLQPSAWMFEDYSKVDQAETMGKQDSARHLGNILRWWQLTSGLRNIYLNNMELYLSVLSFVDSEHMTSEQKQQYALALYFDPKHGLTGHRRQQDPDQKFHDVSKRKFYRAVMGRFLDTKMLQFATSCQESETSNPLITNIHSMWSGNSKRTSEESLEILEVFDFMSNFLLLHILQGPDTVATWARLLEGAEARAALVSDRNDTVLHNWMSLLPHLQPYLSPFDILAAFRMDEIDRETLQYFTSLLALVGHDQDPPGMGEIEKEVSCKLKKEYNVADRAWERYRLHGWRNDARGAIFDERPITRDIAEKIAVFRCHGLDWWRSIEHASNDAPQDLYLFFGVPDCFLRILSTFCESTDSNQDICFIVKEENILKLK